MFVKSVIDSAGPNGPAVGSIQRSALTVAPVTEAVELPDVAVSALASGQSIPHDQSKLEHHTHILGKLRSSVEDVIEKRKAIEELDAIRAKVLLGDKDALNDVAFTFEKKDVGAINPELLLGKKGDNKSKEGEQYLKEHGEDEFQIKKAADPQTVLNKIDLALDRIGQLRSKLDQDEVAAYDRLISFTVSVSGLNVARTQVADSEYSVSAASTAVESIMTNLRSAVIAHGGASADIVRLVLAS